MNTNSRITTAAAAVTGARHVRAGRNGQDAAIAWSDGSAGAVVVCDGCGSGASSEVGARIGARLVLAALMRRVGPRSASHMVPSDPALWTEIRSEVVAALDGLARAMQAETDGDIAQLIQDHFLFTIVAAVVVDDEVAVWSVGDGAYAIDGCTRVLGPFAHNQPPYVAYDLFDVVAPAELDTRSRARTVVVATDGVAEIGLGTVGDIDRYLQHPDALRRELAVLARTGERVDWEARRVVRTPATLQDDGAVAILRCVS